MAAVVEKQFVWRFVDEVSAGLRQAQSLMEQTLEVFRSAGAIANESANGLNVFGDDAKSSAEKVNEAMNKCQSDINKVKESVNGLPKDKNVDIETKANISGVKEAENEINKIPKEKNTEINAKANDNAVNRFTEEVNKIPKEKNTEFNAKANDSAVNKFKEEVNTTPKERITNLLAKISGNGINSFKRNVEDVPKEHTTTLKVNATGESKIKSFGETLKGTALGMGVYNVAMQAGTAISNQFAGAISRYDTLNNFPRILESMGASAGDANKSMAILKKGVDGLPTSLDDVAKASERFLPMSKNAQDASKSALALNDAFLASGASSEDASRGLEQYTQMLSSGKVDMQSWKTLEETMPASLKKVSESFGVTGGSAQGLYKKLQSGQITMQQLNQRFQELDKGTGGFHQTALNATAGIGTAFTNMGNRIKASLQVAIGGLDNLVKSLTGKSIAGNINDLSSKFSNFGKEASNALQNVAGYIKPLIPAFSALGSIIGSIFKGAIQPIKDIGSALSDMFKKAKDNGAFNSIAKALQDIAKNKTALEGVGKAITGMIAAFAGAKVLGSTFTMITKGIGAFVTFGKAISNIKSFAGALSILQYGLKGLVSALGGIPGLIAITVGAFITLYNVSPKFRKFVNDLLKDAKNFAKDFVKNFKSALDNVGKFFKGDLGWQKSLEKNLSKIGSSITKDVQGWGKNISKGLSTASKTIDSWGKSAKKNMSNAMSNIQKGMFSAMKNIQKFWSSSWQTLQKIFSPIMKNIDNTVNLHMSQIRNIIQSVTKIISTIWNTIWKQIENVFKLVWDSIFHKSRVINDVKNIISTGSKATQVIWQNVWNIIRNYFSMVWDAIKNIANSAINTVKNIISNVTRGIQSIWNNIWGAVRDYLRAVWDSIQSNVNRVMNGIHDTISNILNRISSVWHGMWNSMSDAFHGIWDKIKGYASDGMNGVIDVINAGINGIDAVWKFFTGHETSLHHLSHVKFANGGVVGGNQLSMVNDGGGSHWKELIEEPDGNMFMSNERNAILPLKPGTRVYNGEETHQIMSALGVEHYATGGVVGNGGIKRYADGGVVGDLIDWGHHELSNLGSWIKDKWDAITKFLKHPIENTKEIISKAITGPLSKIPSVNMVELGKGIFDKLTKPISDWFKKGLEEAKKKHDEESVGGFGNIKDMKNSAELRDLVKAALEANGLSTPDDMIARVMRQIATESGGNAHAVQPGADPDGDGSGPALGLMQTKRGTFNQYKAPGHDDIFNAYDNLLAALNYAKHRYGPSLSFLGNGHGYATGGHIMGQELAWIGDNPEHEEFVINPYAPSARPLLKQAMDRTQSVQPVSQTDISNSDSDNQIGERIVELLELILQKDSYVNLEDAGQRLRSNDAQSLRMVNMQRGV